MQWTDEHTIETPEQIDVALEIAGLGSRFLAQVYDWIFKGLSIALVVLAVIVALGLLGVRTELRSGESILLILGLFVAYLLVFGADVFFEVRWNGQTPGKWLVGIRVIREGGGPIDVNAALIRNLLGLADMLPAFYLLGALLVLSSRRGQRLGDMAAGTVVVRERVIAAPLAFPPEVAALATDEFTFTPGQLEACGAESRFILRSFFQRQPLMHPFDFAQLGERLAGQFLHKTGYQPPQPLDNTVRMLAFLASLYRDLELLAKAGK